VRLENTESWMVSSDIAMPLQFGAYVGQREGFSTDDTTTPRSQAESEWREWWALLPTHGIGICDPLGFTRLADKPALQNLCQAYWSAFHFEWSGRDSKRTRMIAEMHRQLGDMDLRGLVAECLREAGRLDYRPFRLKVDFVFWPEDYRQFISETHLVLGTRYLEAAQTEALRAILKSSISKLA
jgi:hypothetical protein